MVELWKIPPGPDALRELEVRDKPDWKGAQAWTVGILMWLGIRLRWLAGVFVGVVLAGFFIPHGQWVSVSGAAAVATCLTLLYFDVDGLTQRAYDRFIQVLGGRIYRPAGRLLSRSILDHEAVHDWQARTRGQLRYALLYTLVPSYRRHAEAMAYAMEVAWHGRDPEEAARTAADPVYVMFWEPRDARVLIDAYVQEFRERWNPARWDAPTAEVP